MSWVVDRFIATALTTNDPLNYIKPLLNFCHWHCRPKLRQWHPATGTNPSAVFGPTSTIPTCGFLLTESEKWLHFRPWMKKRNNRADVRGLGEKACYTSAF